MIMLSTGTVCGVVILVMSVITVSSISWDDADYRPLDYELLDNPAWAYEYLDQSPVKVSDPTESVQKRFGGVNSYRLFLPMYYPSQSRHHAYPSYSKRNSLDRIIARLIALQKGRRGSRRNRFSLLRFGAGKKR